MEANGEKSAEEAQNGAVSGEEENVKKVNGHSESPRVRFSSETEETPPSFDLRSPSWHYFGPKSTTNSSGSTSLLSPHTPNTQVAAPSSWDGSSASDGPAWGADARWILLYDQLLKHPGGRGARGCRCDVHSPVRESLGTWRSYRRKSSTGDSQVNEDEVDRVIPKKASNVTAVKKGKSTIGASRSGTSTPVTSGGGASGAGSVDEEMFIRAFEDVPSVRLFSSKELEEQMTSIRTIVSDPAKDWDKRVDALKKVRSIVIAGGANFDEFHAHLRLLEPAFQISVKDLRSQVVREACITIAYLSQQLGQKFDHFAEALLPCLINLIMNCAKIVASSGMVTIRFVIMSTHSPRLVPIVASGLTSKSKDIRRATCDFLHLLLHTWSTHVLERHLALLQDAIRKGIADADPEARASARKAFWAFADHFRDQADSLLNSLDGSYKRLLYGELSSSTSVSNSSSSNSLVTMAAPGRIPKAHATPSAAARAPSTGSAESLPLLVHSQRPANQPRQFRPHPHSPPSHLPPVSARPLGVRAAGSVESLPLLLHQPQRDHPFHHHHPHQHYHSQQYHPLQHSSSPPSSTGVAARRGSSGIPVLVGSNRGYKGEADGSPRRHFYGMGGVGGGGVGSALRSNSAIDLQAAQRAKARAQYAAAARLKVGSGASLRDDSSSARPRKTVDGGANVMSVSAITSPERVGRTRSRVAGVSQSQPSSRSGSPSSRLSYATYSSQLGGGSILEGTATSSHHRPRHLSGIPRSTGTSREASRETSPNGRHYAPQNPLSSSISPSSHLYHHGRLSSLGKNRGTMLSGRDRPPLQQVTVSRPVMAQKILQQSREAESALADALNFDGLSISDEPHIAQRRKSSSTSGGSAVGFRPFDDHSDDSETSSVCSERSFDSFRRPSDPYSWSGSQQRLYRDVWEPSCKDISEIIANCASTHWGDRKEGLVGLQLYFQNGKLLTGSELKKIIEIFTKMFMDTHTKVFSLFLDTLNELVASHNSDLHDWLYILITRLLNKLGTDLLSSTQNKIHKTLEIIRDSFPYDLQMYVILRFLVDQTQTPNAKVKVAMLTYLARLAACMEATDYSFISGGSSISGQVKDTSTMSRLALVKMIGWTSESKGSPLEVRKAAQAAVVALFDLNTPEVTMILSHLPEEFQVTASQVVQNHIRRSSTGGGSGMGEGSSSPPVVTSPRMPGSPLHAHNAQHLHHHSPSLLPSSPQSPRIKRDLGSGGIHDDENLNPDEVYRSLRKTTAEIQNYSFEAGKGGADRDTNIGPLSLGAADRLVDDRNLGDIGDNSISNSVSQGSGHSSSLSSPTRLPSFNGIDKSSTSPADSGGGGSFDAIASPENGFSPRGSHLQVALDDSENLRRVIEVLSSPKSDVEMEVDGSQDSVDGGKGYARTEADKKAALTQLIRIVRDGSTLAVMDHFKPILRLLLEQLSGEGAIRALALGALSEMLRKRSFAAAFAQYVELLVTKVLFAHKDTDKDVVRAAETCAGTMAAVMPADVVVVVLILVIKTEEFPVNQAAIKMLTRLVEQRGRAVIEPLLPQIMPGLVKAYDNEVSCVRKSAVFCMVAVHLAVGEEVLAPHLSDLNGSKMKLLHLYIRKAKQQQGDDSCGHSRGMRSGSSGGGDGGGTGSESSSASSPKHTPT